METAHVLRLVDSKFKDLYMCFCGHSQCQPYHHFGPGAKPNYIIHYILEGKGIYKVGETKYELKAGQGFLIEPEKLIYYEADKEEPWTYLWIGFLGDRAKEYLSDIGLNSGQLIFHSSYGSELESIVQKMLKHNNLSVSNMYYLNSLLYEFFAVLTKDMVLREEKGESRESLYAKQAINYIQNNYSMGIKVTDVAEYISVSRSYLYKIFEEYLEMSPQEFLNTFRITRARGLLRITELSVEEVAASCGYQDALVFSKAFKKMVGMPPTAYRKKNSPGLYQKKVMENEDGQSIELVQKETF